jgi:hypothetical protein
MHTHLTPQSHARYRPLGLRDVALTGGFWKERQTINRQVTLRHGFRMLEESGTLNNFRLAAGLAEGKFSGWVFQDSDAYKWLEAAALELVNGPDPELESLINQTIPALAAAQQPDGYLNSHFTVAKPGERWTDLEWAHELYCAGHLIEAAIAHRRATGRAELFDIARRFVDHIHALFGPGRREAACGHPEIEMALVELYRETGERRHLDLAAFFIDQRGHGRVSGLRGVGPAYMQERTPLREAVEVEGHAVRQLYLNAGAADLYLETGEEAWLETLRRLWQDMTAHKMYLTGGFGSRSYGEAFGEAYDLPSKEAYCETCAAIAAMLWNWRMLLATGEARFADLLERSLYNGFLSGVSLTGDRFFYENPLRADGGYERQNWFSCACCPPNLMRQIAALGHYLATTGADGIQIHQYASAQINTPHAALQIETDYPWSGEVKIGIESAAGGAWRLNLRIPAWCAGAIARVNDQPIEAAVAGTYLTLERVWRAGDRVLLDLPLLPRLTAPHPYLDAVRGSLAIERGPLVYCLESVDQVPGVAMADLRIDPASTLRTERRADLPGGVIAIQTEGSVADVSDWAGQLYRPLTVAAPGRRLALTAVPYYAWGNRGLASMRVWIPL